MFDLFKQMPTATHGDVREGTANRCGRRASQFLLFDDDGEIDDGGDSSAIVAFGAHGPDWSGSLVVAEDEVFDISVNGA